MVTWKDARFWQKQTKNISYMEVRECNIYVIFTFIVHNFFFFFPSRHTFCLIGFLWGGE